MIGYLRNHMMRPKNFFSHMFKSDLLLFNYQTLVHTVQSHTPTTTTPNNTHHTIYTQHYHISHYLLMHNTSTSTNLLSLKHTLYISFYFVYSS